jgi:hypothetical protein
MLPDDRISLALASVGTKLEGIAARTLGLMLALSLAGLAGLLSSDAVIAALGVVACGGLIRSRLVVRDALERAGWSDPGASGARRIWPVMDTGNTIARRTRAGCAGSGESGARAGFKAPGRPADRDGARGRGLRGGFR